MFDFVTVSHTEACPGFHTHVQKVLFSIPFLHVPPLTPYCLVITGWGWNGALHPQSVEEGWEAVGHLILAE